MSSGWRKKGERKRGKEEERGRGAENAWRCAWRGRKGWPLWKAVRVGRFWVEWKVESEGGKERGDVADEGG
ncbi:MAG: hypothetical protein ACKESB_00140 [Candidatus Hodgkinia cicadicola]